MVIFYSYGSLPTSYCQATLRRYASHLPTVDSTPRVFTHHPRVNSRWTVGEQPILSGWANFRGGSVPSSHVFRWKYSFKITCQYEIDLFQKSSPLISNQHQLQLSTTMNHHIPDDKQQQPVAFLSLSSFFSSSSLSSSSLPPHTSSGTGSQSSEF